MDHADQIRKKANELREHIRSDNSADPYELLSAEAVNRFALEKLKLHPSGEHPDSTNLHGSLAVLEDDVIFYNRDLEDGYRQFCIAHEIGHYILHTFKPACGDEDISELGTDEEPATAASRVIGYGPQERVELEANLFAIELLLPCPALRKAFLDEGLTASEIAGRTGMRERFVTRQLARAVLIPEKEEPAPDNEVSDDRQKPEEQAPTFELNESQRRAVETDECPVLISAGPGTGKTETLIRRVIHLLENGANPQRILALTFSNKAAQEMRERVAEARPEDAARIPTMTFHSFGYNLLMRYRNEAGIGDDWTLVDQIDSLLMLEKHLNELELEHYLALYDPMRDLPDVLTAISKAKDELCGPERYAELAEKMLTEANVAGEDSDINKAEKALETARIYKRYQALMEENGRLDFGDLIFRTVKMLDANADVLKEIQGLYDHILVDEFQDVNRASGVLLRHVAGGGEGLWAVGDLRQSIYRWRGASPENIRKFKDEYDGARTLSLETNYRSVEPIVRTFGEFGRHMIACEEFNEWEAFRGKGRPKAVTYDAADRFGTEAADLAAHVEEDHDLGFEFKDQAVICRTHSQLADVAEELTGKGIPVFYLGQLFERDEIRHLLSMLDLASSGNCQALHRIGGLAEYAIPYGELLSVLAFAGENQLGFKELDPDDDSLKISDAVRGSLKLLQAHLMRDKETTAYSLLADILFTRSGYLRALAGKGSVAGKQRLIAIYQLLGFAASMEPHFVGSEDQVRDFLDYIRRLVLFREQKSLAEIPAAASGLDAVRLLTVHGAKGLEFGAVHLPFLAAGKFPGRFRGEKCPTPPDLRGDPKEDHEEEEECLFFVALSRARDRLHLSRSDNYSASLQSKPSVFLEKIADVLPDERQVSTDPPVVTEDAIPPKAYTRTAFYAAELDRYLDCPRQFYYRYEVGLKAGDNRNAYQKLHGVVFETLRAVQDSPLRSPEIEDFARETMDRLWEEAELSGHPYEKLYREKAELLLDRIIDRFGDAGLELERKTVSIPLSNGTVRVTSDFVEEHEGSGRVVSRRVKTGKQPKSVKTENSDAMMLRGLKLEYPEAEVTVSNVYLTDDSEYVHEISEKVIGNRIKKYEEAIDGINRGEFDPKPSDFRCPTCAFYLICSAKEPGDGEK